MRAHTLGGAGIASASAGPIFALTLGLGILPISGQPIPIVVDEPFGWVILLIPITLVGAILSLIPNIVGSGLMGWLGRSNAALRLPVAWGIAGGLLAAGWIAFVPEASEMAFPLGATGTVCAMISRRFTVWS